MMGILPWMLVVIGVGSTMIGMSTDNVKAKIIGDIGNAGLMLVLCVSDAFRGREVWCVICGVLFMLDLLCLVIHVAEYKLSQKVDKHVEDEISLNDTKRTLKKFIKEIEDYGSKRH